MTPQLAAKLQIHEQPVTADPADRLPGRFVGPMAVLGPALAHPELDRDCLPSLWRREALHRRMLGLADVLAAALALVVFVDLLGDDRTALAALVSTPLVVVLFKIAGLYDRDELRIVHSTLDETPLLFQLTGLFALTVTMLQPVLVEGALGGAQIAGLWLGAFTAVLAGRVLARWLAGRISPVERCLVIGEPEVAQRLVDKLRSSRAHATVVASLPLSGHELDVFESPESVRALVSELSVHRLILAPAAAGTPDVSRLIRMAKAVGVRVSLLPHMFEAVGSAVQFDDVDGMTMVGVRRFGLPRSSRLIKRAFDLAVGTLLLLICAPAMAAVALAIRLDSPGPVLFRQPRVGREGCHFWIFKFRSMDFDADAHKDELRAVNEAGAGLFKIARDPRVTRVGAFLRRTSLDELPQLLNVLRGEMSLVGPRPLVIDEDALVCGLDRSRLYLTPGMTGPWQVLGTRVPMQEMVGIDYLYVANWSLWLDLKLLLRTVGHVLRSGNV